MKILLSNYTPGQQVLWTFVLIALLSMDRGTCNTIMNHHIYPMTCMLYLWSNSGYITLRSQRYHSHSMYGFLIIPAMKNKWAFSLTAVINSAFIN